MLKCVS